MKTKILFLFAFLITLSSFNLTQVDDTQLYKVSIFKWYKSESGQEQMKIIVINQDGTVKLNGKSIEEKFHMKKFAMAVNKFIQGEKLVKEEANNEPPKVATVPKNGEQSVSMTIIKLKDFNDEKDKDFANNSKYSHSKIKKSSDQNIELYKYLQSDEIRLLKKLLSK